jgi:hypothetical protein
MNVIKLGVELGLTLKFTTQATTRVALWWSGLGPQLGESSLEGLPRRACHYPSNTMPTPCTFLASHYCSFMLLLCSWRCWYVICVCPPIPQFHLVHELQVWRSKLVSNKLHLGKCFSICLFFSNSFNFFVFCLYMFLCRNFLSTFYTFPFHELFLNMFCTIVKGDTCEHLLL